MKSLFVLNNPPYGTERCYNALRLASALLKNNLGSTRAISRIDPDDARQGARLRGSHTGLKRKHLD